jgi:hypothetical protein
MLTEELREISQLGNLLNAIRIGVGDSVSSFDNGASENCLHPFAVSA